MSDASQTYTAKSNISDATSSKSGTLDTHPALSEVHTNDSRPWDVSRTDTECQVCTQYPEIAWSVQQLCQKLWPTCYEEIQITRLAGGSFNRIFALTFPPSAVLHPPVLNSFLDHQPLNTRRGLPSSQKDFGFGEFILRVSRGWENDGEIEHHVDILSYVQLHTDIPSPRILAYDSGSDNDVELPYTLQTRIPGVPLSTILGSLTFSQRLDLVHEIATIIKKTQKIMGPVPGKIGVPKTTDKSESKSDGLVDESASLEEKLAVMSTASSTMIADNQSAEQKTNPLIKSADALKILHYDLVTMRSDDDPYNGTINTVKSSVEGQSVLTFFNFQLARFILHTIHNYEYDVRNTFFFQSFMRVVNEMDEELSLGTDVFNLFHGDLEPRNILVQICDFGKLHISGIVDWDLAAFVPRAISCLPPRWLWAPEVPKNANEREDEPDPTDSEGKTLKKAFDDLMGENYVEMAYDPEFAILRRLFRLAVGGIITKEHHDEAEAIIADWARLKAIMEKCEAEQPEQPE